MCALLQTEVLGVVIGDTATIIRVLGAASYSRRTTLQLGKASKHRYKPLHVIILTVVRVKKNVPQTLLIELRIKHAQDGYSKHTLVSSQNTSREHDRFLLK
jgi:hypothetical protein